jgi:hypothetical protein
MFQYYNYLEKKMKKLFNKNIITKIFIIFIIGFFSRVLINYFDNINIFVENYFILCFILIINEILLLLDFQLDTFTFFNYIYLLLKYININNKITLTNSYYLENKNIIFTNNVNNNNISLKDKVRRYSH